MAGARQGRIRNPYSKILVILVISTVAYSIGAVLAFNSMTNLPLQDGVFMVAAGFSLGYMLLSRLFRLDTQPRHFNLKNMFGGASLALSMIMTFAAFKLFTLASVYPVVAAAVVVFFTIDYARFGKKLSRAEALALSAGVLMVFIGTFFAESHGFAFNMNALPYVIGITVFGGTGFYFVMYNIERRNAGARSASIPLMLAAVSGAGLIIFGAGSPSAIFLAIGIVAGFFTAIAMMLEFVAMEREESRSAKGNLIKRNFINNFTYLDVVMVLAFSVLIKSYTVQEVAGGLTIVLGVIIIGFVR